MDFPRRALPDEPDDVDSYVARRSRGFTPADDVDSMTVRPARAAHLLEPTTAIDPSPRPRRALFTEPLMPDADDEKSTATEAGIGRRAMQPIPQAVAVTATSPEDSVPVRAQPAPLPPPPAPLPLTRTEPSRMTASPASSAEMPRTVLPPAPIMVPPVPSSTPIPAATSPASMQLSAETAYAAQPPSITYAAPPPPAPRPQPRPATRAAEPIERPASRQSEPALRNPAPVTRRRTASRSTVRHDVAPIIVDRLIKSYNGRLAVRDLSFVVQPGRVTGFLGPNGAGKTTTMRILVGLTTPTTGTATFGERTYVELPHPQRTVGCVLDASFHPTRSGRNHLRVLAPTAGASDRRVDKLLDAVGLGDVARQPVAEYSTGMRQRLALAAAMLGNPDYLILDEPANGLDPEGIRWLREFLRDFAARGRAVLISSHLLNEIEATADDIVVIDRGRLLAQLPMSELNLGEGRDLEQEFFSMLEGST